MFKKSISFKDSEKGLYKHLCNQFCPSAYVKQLIKEDIERKKQNQNDNNFSNFQGFKY